MVQTCKKCKGNNLKIDSTYCYHDIYECLDCSFLGHSGIEECCRNPFLVVSILRYDHDRYSLYHQCLNCGGASKTKHLKSKDYSENIRAEFSEQRFDNWKFEKITESNLIYEGIRHSNYKNTRAYRYYEYLTSDEWKKKRIKVMERDDFLCQICKTEKANDIHHLTYENLFNEPLEDLQALCRACHVNLHQ